MSAFKLCNSFTIVNLYVPSSFGLWTRFRTFATQFLTSLSWIPLCRGLYLFKVDTATKPSFNVAHKRTTAAVAVVLAVELSDAAVEALLPKGGCSNPRTYILSALSSCWKRSMEEYVTNSQQQIRFRSPKYLMWSYQSQCHIAQLVLAFRIRSIP